MKYKHVVEGTFIKRPNRFIAHVMIDGKEEICHVKNTGRCKELLIAGCTVYLEKSDNPNRKTAYDVIAVKKGERLINMDSQIPNACAFEWYMKHKEELNIVELKREVSHGNSRFDLWGKKEDGTEFFTEVKGVTLEKDDVVMFPDAPTERGVKHVQELSECIKEGYEANILFVIQMSDVEYFTPNMETHKAFGEALRKAKKQGVTIMAKECMVSKDELLIRKDVKVVL